MASFIKIICHAVFFWVIVPDLSGRQFNSTTIRDLLVSSYQESLEVVDEALFHSRHRRSTASSSRPMAMFLRQTEPETMEISRAAEVFQTTLQVLKNRVRRRYKRDVTAAELLSWDDVELISELSRCPPAPHPGACQDSQHDKYRHISGLCNNRQNPLWGAANTVLVRWLPAEYEDGEREPKGWNPPRLHNGFQLPSVWKVSKEILQSSSKPRDDNYSQLLVEWGQYIDHDITFTPQTTSVDCLNTCESVHPCFSIKTGDACMPFYRSTPACFVDSGFDMRQTLQRQQMNSITSFIDASVVYGHNPELQVSLRNLSSQNGKLAIHDKFRDPKGRPYLPSVASLPSGCLQDIQQPEGPRVECFNAGDSRVNEGLPLTTLHTLWLREHNRIAQELRVLNAHWTSDTVYQETRKIIGALHQMITMRDYIPKIIGPKSYEHYIGPYEGYNPTVNPSASNVFATAAFRFGHATISSILRRLNESFQEHERFPHLRLHSTFFSPWRIVKEGGIEPVLRGIIGTAAPAVSATMLLAEELTKRLVILNIPQKMDLAALNLQRGRDHALPVSVFEKHYSAPNAGLTVLTIGNNRLWRPLDGDKPKGYNKWRIFCELRPIRTLNDFTDVVGDETVAKKILKIYKHPDNIDVWLGGLIENVLPGSRTGPLFSCLISKQMKVLRDGDRFWWEAEGQFTHQQKTELLQTSMSRIICDNSDIKEVCPDSFRLEKHPSGYIPCDQIPSMKLTAWRERSLF